MITVETNEAVWQGCLYPRSGADGWTTLWRLDPGHPAMPLTGWQHFDGTEEPMLLARAQAPSGVRAVWQGEIKGIECELRTTLEGEVDVIADGELAHRVTLAAGEQRISLAVDAKNLQFWMPVKGAVSIRHLRVQGHNVSAVTPQEPVWAAYGSSITHSADAAGPTESWPAIVARNVGWNLLNLGFGGECHLDAPSLDALRDSQADVISLCLGVNIWSAASYSQRTLPNAMFTFLRSVREAHQGVPILVGSSFIAPRVEGEKNKVAMTMQDVRNCVSTAVQALIDDGDSLLSFFDGTTVITAEEALSCYTDSVHLGPDGNRLIGERMTNHFSALGPRINGAGAKP